MMYCQNSNPHTYCVIFGMTEQWSWEFNWSFMKGFLIFLLMRCIKKNCALKKIETGYRNRDICVQCSIPNS